MGGFLFAVDRAGFFGSPFYIFCCVSFFSASLMNTMKRLAGRRRSIAHLLEHHSAAGASAIATVVVFSFVGVWNDFFNPLIYINSFEKATLTLGLNFLKTQIIGSGITQWHILMAASVLVLVPNVIIFFLAQHHFIKGINVGGLRG